MVPQGGIEPPTQGFSVLCSTDWATEAKMAVWTGLEPAISSVTDWHVNRLHHQTLLNYFGCGSRIWTYDLRVMSPTSYQTAPSREMAEKEGFEPPRDFHPLSVFKTDPFNRAWVFLREFIRLMVDPAGLEPATNRLWAGGSNQLSYKSS